MNEVALDFVLPANFRTATQFASLEISSDQPLSIAALRMTTNQRNEALFTTTPVADLTKAPTNDPIYFPQFADGGGYTSSIILLNTSSSPETGTFNIKDNNGNPWSPGWGTINLKLSYLFLNRISVMAGVENILDLRYRPYSSGIAAAGRNFIASVRLEL